MTREEAVDFLSQYVGNDCYTEKCQEAHSMAVSTLRPVSRGQVEQMRSRWVPLNNTQEHFCESCGVAFNLYAYCKYDYQFCPACGAPITDEAVDIVMRRLEALKDGL